jgi:uncharacterized membrane protein HdeD (DUF308 family)
MLETLRQHRWLFVIRGIAAIIFGVIALLSPEIALTSLVLLFAAYAVVDGIASIVMAFRVRDTNNRWWVLLLEGIVSVAAGVIIFIAPLLATVVLTTFALYLIAIWAIATGVLEIITAIRMRKEIENEVWLGLAGLLSIIFGVVLAFFPGAGILSLIWLIGIYAIIFGVSMIMLAIRIGGLPSGQTPTDTTRVGV